MVMDDTQIRAHMERLVEEEHELLERGEQRSLTPEGRKRLELLEVQLDQFWDLLRQRRAKREFGLNPKEAEARDEKTIKGYIG
jgi:hypothetical protein